MQSLQRLPEVFVSPTACLPVNLDLYHPASLVPQYSYTVKLVDKSQKSSFLPKLLYTWILPCCQSCSLLWEHQSIFFVTKGSNELLKGFASHFTQAANYFQLKSSVKSSYTWSSICSRRCCRAFLKPTNAKNGLVFFWRKVVTILYWKNGAHRIPVAGLRHGLLLELHNIPSRGRLSCSKINPDYL